MGPGFLLKIDQFRTLAYSPETTTLTIPQAVRTICKHIGGVQGAWSDFWHWSKSAIQSKPWTIAQDFCSKSANFGPLRIYPKTTRTIPQAVRSHSQACRRRFREFGAISGTYQNPPFKALAMAQGFYSKSAEWETSESRDYLIAL